MDQLKDYEIILGKDGHPIVEEFHVGETVLDDLTSRISKIVKITPIKDWKDDKGNIIVHNAWKGNQIKLDNPHLDGWRYEWEVTKVRKK